MKTLSPLELRKARDSFEELLKNRSSEGSFQTLFKECPYILSRSLPLRLEPTDIRPLGRRGHSEADFVFYPRTQCPIPLFGVIELKRPDTKLLTEPRKGIVVLTRDANTAVAQAQEYARKLRRDVISRFRTNLIIGNSVYAFIIAGLTDELAYRVLSGQLLDGLDGLIPSGCQIIPYDSLFERYASGIPSVTMILTPVGMSELEPLDALLARAMEAEPKRRNITDENMDFWIQVETEWRTGKYIGTKRTKIIDRNFWCITGTNVLATESPAHIEFPAYVQTLIDRIRASARMHNALERVAAHGVHLYGIKEFLSHKQYTVLAEAVKRCRETGLRSTWMFPLDDDVDFLERLGLVRFWVFLTKTAKCQLEPFPPP